MSRRQWHIAGLALSLWGCSGPDIDAICREQEGCFGGNEMDIEACIVSLEGYQDAMDAIGCRDEFDVYYECVSAGSSCRSIETGASCASNDDCQGQSGSGFSAVCSGGVCVAKFYGYDPQADQPCEAEGNAFQRCN